MERITSRHNPLITRLRRLGAEKKARRAEGVLLCEGEKLVGEALRWGAELELLVVAEGTAPPPALPAALLSHQRGRISQRSARSLPQSHRKWKEASVQRLHRGEHPAGLFIRFHHGLMC